MAHAVRIENNLPISTLGPGRCDKFRRTFNGQRGTKIGWLCIRGCGNASVKNKARLSFPEIYFSSILMKRVEALLIRLFRRATDNLILASRKRTTDTALVGTTQNPSLDAQRPRLGSHIDGTVNLDAIGFGGIGKCSTLLAIGYLLCRQIKDIATLVRGHQHLPSISQLQL